MMPMKGRGAPVQAMPAQAMGPMAAGNMLSQVSAPPQVSPQQQQLQDFLAALQQPDVQSRFAPVQVGTPNANAPLSQFIAALKQGNLK